MCVYIYIHIYIYIYIYIHIINFGQAFYKTLAVATIGESNVSVTLASPDEPDLDTPYYVRVRNFDYSKL